MRAPVSPGPFFASPKGLPVLEQKWALAKRESIQHASLVQQSGVDDLPLVAAAWSEIQERGLLVLKFAEEFQRVPGGWRRWIDRLGLKPAIPFQKKERFPFVLFH